MIKFFLNVSLLIICLVSCSKSIDSTNTTNTNPVSITTVNITSVSDSTASIMVDITNKSNFVIPNAGIIYSTDSTKIFRDGLSNEKAITLNAVLAGNYTINLNALIPQTKYFVRGYIVYDSKTYYGDVQSFTTAVAPTITTKTLTSIDSTSAIASCTITNPNGLSITAAGFAYSSSNRAPTTTNDYLTINNTGKLTGDYTLNLTPLKPYTTYYVRSYINYNGSIYYGNVQSFTTLPTLPTININPIINFSTKTADVPFTIFNQFNLSITKAGIVYSSSNNTPTTTDGNVVLGSTGILAGNYTLGLSSLTANTTYNVRGYIIYNGNTYYGTVKTFTTAQIPTITTNAIAVADIDFTSAVANFTITNPSTASIYAAGIAYSSSNTTPTIANGYVAHSSTGNLAGNYTLNITSLIKNTLYYIRGWINIGSTIYYGNTQSFTTKLLPNSVTNIDNTMVTVPAGSFTMGATSEQLANNGDGFSVLWSPTTQQVTLSSFKICKFEVTQQLWQDVMGSNPSYFTGNLQRPVERVSWNDCQTFITKLNQLTGKNYRLPTEAEWEYAARGGANSTYSYIYSGGNTLNLVAWNINNSNSQTQTVGTKQANALGLYDMSGNVWEWCNDWYGNYSNTAVANPQGPATGSNRVIRGGSWNSYGSDLRVSIRNDYGPSFSHYAIGIRLAISSN